MSGASDGEKTSPEELRATGRLSEAARAYRTRGDLPTAEKLFVEVWEFDMAAEVAAERGDLPAELSHRLASNDPQAVAALLRKIEAGTPVDIAKAAGVLERHRRWTEAAALHERVGALEIARELYRRGQALLDVARVERLLGRVHEAGLVYEQILQREPDGLDALKAHEALGHLLLSLDRPDEAARHLQAAWVKAPVDEPTRAAILSSLVVALDRLGYPTAADETLATLRELRPTTVSRAELVAQHRRVASDGTSRIAGRYELIKVLGAGASGRVHLARDLVTGRQVAVKTIDAAPDRRAAPMWVRYFAETRLVGALHHPNVVEILDVNPHLGLIVMEYVPGGTLADRLSALHGKALKTAAVWQLLLDALDALAAIHARGLIHRDIKPANLFFNATGQLKLGDFGSAYLLSEEATQTAGFVGTLAYMSPEQMTGAEVDFSTDLYGLGAVAFHAITGRLPFLGPDFVSQHLGEQAPLPSSLFPALHPGWDGVIAAMLQKHPRARPSSIDEVRRAVLAIPLMRDDEREQHKAVPEATGPRHGSEARYRVIAHLAPGAGGASFVALDTRLDRLVVVETLSAAYLATADGAQHIAWLRDFARWAGPRVQRIFALRATDDGGIEAVFEPTPPCNGGSVSTRNRALVRASLSPLHARGTGHGSLPSSLALDSDAAPVVIIAGRTPRAAGAIQADEALT